MIAITDAAREALEILRDPTTFEWSTVALLGLVLYVYSVEVERRRWDIVGYMTFFLVAAWVYDMGDDRRRQLRVVGALAAVVLALGVVLGFAGRL